MSNPLGWFLAVVGMVVLLLMAFLAALARRGRPAGGRGVAPVNQGAPSGSRDDLLRNGLRMQATITDIRSPRTMLSGAQSSRRFATTATAYDLDTGLPRRFTQRGDTPLGHIGDPVTVLIDPTRPSVYLIVR